MNQTQFTQLMGELRSIRTVLERNEVASAEEAFVCPDPPPAPEQIKPAVPAPAPAPGAQRKRGERNGRGSK